jgi:hypothetical protein
MLNLNRILSIDLPEGCFVAGFDCGEKAARRLHPVIFHSHFPSLSKTQTKRFTRISL